MKNHFFSSLLLSVLLLLFSFSAYAEPAQSYELASGENVTIPASASSLAIPEDYDRTALINVHFDHADLSAFSACPDGAFDLTSFQNLQAVYFNFEVTEEMSALLFSRVLLPQGAEVLRFYPELGTPDTLSASASDGKVTLSFSTVPGALRYHVIRVKSGSGAQGIHFYSDLPADAHRFSLSNEKVCFTDDTVQPGVTYHYLLRAENPFVPGTPTQVEIAVPPASGNEGGNQGGSEGGQQGSSGSSQQPGLYPNGDPVLPPAASASPASPVSVPHTGDAAAPLFYLFLLSLSVFLLVRFHQKAHRS